MEFKLSLYHQVNQLISINGLKCIAKIMNVSRINLEVMYFFVYSVKGAGKKKKIYNTEVIDDIIKEINRLN